MDEYLKEALEIVKAQASVRTMTEEEITSMVRAVAQSIRDITDGPADIQVTAVADAGVQFAFARIGNRGATEGALSADEFFFQNAAAVYVAFFLRAAVDARERRWRRRGGAGRFCAGSGFGDGPWNLAGLLDDDALRTGHWSVGEGNVAVGVDMLVDVRLDGNGQQERQQRNQTEFQHGQQVSIRLARVR